VIAVAGLDSVEEALERALASDVSLLSGAASQLVLSGGKRLRPKTVLLAHEAAGGEDRSQAVRFATIVELVHTASLIHDDINDRSGMRRGEETVNARWGDGLALLTGDFVFVRMLSLLAGLDSRVLDLLSNACQCIVEGEALEVLSLGDTAMSEEGYLDIVSRKTASLFAVCAESGGVLAGASEERIGALRSYGLNLGIAFQIRDDTLDLVGQVDDLGKPVASDLAQGKMSLATICALSASSAADEILSSADRLGVVEMLQDSGALSYALQKAEQYADSAKDSLSVLPPSGARAALRGMADFAVARVR
jgi:octaprenyl-diphosphate synthase